VTTTCNASVDRSGHSWVPRLTVTHRRQVVSDTRDAQRVSFTGMIRFVNYVILSASSTAVSRLATSNFTVIIIMMIMMMVVVMMMVNKLFLYSFCILLMFFTIHVHESAMFFSINACKCFQGSSIRP